MNEMALISNNVVLFLAFLLDILPGCLSGDLTELAEKGGAGGKP